jgi:demethylmenaquinone methyltransferase/2-methoxy-6-polyprenyl-1,4-benzoquinol methylase
MGGVAEGKIGRMFSALAPRYRLFNRWSSLGLDSWWRQRLLREVVGTRRVLDLGTGTGDLAWALGVRAMVAGMDLSLDMLRQARNYGPGPSPHWIQGSAVGLPFGSGSFDVVVSAFVLRNLWVGGILSGALGESARVLEPGGRVVFLDLTRPVNPFLRWGHGVYNRTVVPFFGKVLFGKEWPGAYLANSIQGLPDPVALRRLFLDNGFSQFEHRPLSGGIVSLFIGKK